MNVAAEVKDGDEIMAPVRDKVFQFAPRTETADQAAPAPRRDWGAAIDLIKEASEAVRLAEERATTAEEYSHQLSNFHKEQLKTMEAKIATAERRAEVANLRAVEAESWLARYHDAIVQGFGTREKS